VFADSCPRDGGSEILLHNIHHLAPSLTTLVLGLKNSNASTESLLDQHFTRLTTLVLESFYVGEESLPDVMAFWQRHPTLERLEIVQKNPINVLFDDTIEVGLLPNLKYLKVEIS